MAPRGLRVEQLRDFRGGLNVRADPFELQPNESPDLLNVDPDPRGGVELRRGATFLPVVNQTPNLLLDSESTFEGGIGGIGGLLSCTVAQSPTYPRDGIKSLAVTQNVPGASYFFTGVDGSRTLVNGQRVVPVFPNTTYTLSGYVRSSVSRSLFMNIRWYNAVGTLISDSSEAISATYTFAHTLRYISALSPATAVWANFWVYIPASGAVGDVHYWDNMMFNLGPNYGSFQDPDQSVYEFDGPILGMQRFEQYGAFEQLLVCTATTLYVIDFVKPALYLNGGYHWQMSIIGAWGAAAGFQFHNGNDTIKSYIFNINGVASWNGTTFAGMTNSFNDNLGAPTYANIPLAKYGASHGGSAWIAWTKEGYVEKPNRVRFSHPNSAGDWRSFDYFDIEPGANGDYITALVPFKDKLLVFKKSSVFAIVGNSPENYAVIPIARDIGAVSNKAVVATDNAVYFFHWPMGVMKYDGRALSWEFSRLQPLIDKGLIDYAKPDQIYMGWSVNRNRIWVSVPWKAASSDATPTGPTRTYVLDPSLGKDGCWTCYDLVPKTMYTMVWNGLGGYLMSSHNASNKILLLDWPGEPLAFDYLTEGVTAHIKSYYVTSWVDVKQPAVIKRWKAPEFVMRGGNAYKGTVDVFTDYDTNTVRNKMDLDVPLDNIVMNWGDNWGENWGPARTSTQNNRVIKGNPIGSARAIALRLNGPDTDSYWGVNAIICKFIPKPLK